ncbi:SOS response-associated peptidase family protein [Sodalis sp. dw_96]|uniref:SOS response-associated peptidase family protein n=1 Tax=Sodalis sp. dw_96 TaxID=2719794 RepID=UPI001BD5DB47|nr:SOS response-associated peptidase family protein [Sodalis sp. dw_96]
MCGRFAQFETKEEYLEFLNAGVEFVGVLDGEPIGRYNVAPGTRVLMLNQRDDKLHLDPVNWGYQPAWAKESGRTPMINARVETAAASRMFKPLWNTGRALIMADGWYEWKKVPGDAKAKQPYFIYHQNKKPIFLAAISRFHADALDAPDEDGFVIVTAASDKGLLDIHDRRPLVMTRKACLEWLSFDTSPEHAEQLALDCGIPADEFTFHPVGKAVGNIHNNSAAIIKSIENPII